VTKLVIALCLFINGQLVEHRVQNSMGTCLKMKREATRNMDMTNKQFMCGQVEAHITINIDGSESIDKIVIESK
jgi:predicted RND superfamily exporter protein